MSSSPFADFANSTLRFQVSSGTLKPDRNGNLRPGTAIIEVEALLQQGSDRSGSSGVREQNQPGADSSQIFVNGYITSVSGTDSLVLPSLITPDSKCQAAWQGRNGQFFLQFQARNPYLASLGIDLVEKIQGYFQPSNFTVEGDPFVPQPPTPQPVSGDVISIPFAFGDATPKAIAELPANTTIFTAQIVIQTAFNGVGAALALGDLQVSDRLLRSDQNDPKFVAEYETNPGYTYISATQLLLTITPGEGCTQGAGFVLLEV